MGAEQRHEGAELVPAGLEFTPFVEARGDLADVVKGGDLSFELIQIRFPVRLKSRNRGGKIIPERCRNALTVQGFDNWDTLGKACLSTASAVDQRIPNLTFLLLYSNRLSTASAVDHRIL